MQTITMIGLDIAKSVFQVHGMHWNPAIRRESVSDRIPRWIACHRLR